MSNNRYTDHSGNPQHPADRSTYNPGPQEQPADEEPGYYGGHGEDRVYSDTVPLGSLSDPDNL